MRKSFKGFDPTFLVGLAGAAVLACMFLAGCGDSEPKNGRAERTTSTGRSPNPNAGLATSERSAPNRKRGSRHQDDATRDAASGVGSAGSKQGSHSSGSSTGSVRSGASGGTATEKTTKAAFIRKANAICGQTLTEVTSEVSAALGSRQGKQGYPATAEAVLVSTVVGPALLRQVERIGALARPVGDEQQIESILDVTRDAIAAIERDPRAAVESGRALEEPTRLAERYGLTACPYG